MILNKVHVDLWYRIGFWFLFLFMIGFISGVFCAKEVVIKPKLEEAKIMSGLVIDGQPYNLVKR